MSEPTQRHPDNGGSTTSTVPPDSNPTDTALGKARSAAGAARTSRWWVGPVIALVALLVVLPFGYTLKIGVVTSLTTVLMVMVMAQGWNILGGYGGYMNFGIVVFFGVGALTAGILNRDYDWPMWATILPAGLMAALVALPVGLATLRLRGHYFAIFTLILTFLMQTIAMNSDYLGGVHGIYTTVEGDHTPRSLAALFFYALLALAVIATVVVYWVEHSNFGYALRAIREDEVAAGALGVRTDRVKLTGLLMGAAFAGLAGSVYAFLTGYIEPTGAFDLGLSLDVVLVCIVGGLGTWQGAALGATFVVLLEDWMRTTIPELSVFGTQLRPELSRVVVGVLLIVFALFIRRGLVGLVRARRGRASTI